MLSGHCLFQIKLFAEDGMKNKIIDILRPDDFHGAEMVNFAACELLINALIFSENNNIKFFINSKLRLVECNDSDVKKILDVLYKSGMMPEVKNQILKFLHKDGVCAGALGQIKILIGDEKICLTITEIKTGENFSWTIIREIN